MHSCTTEHLRKYSHIFYRISPQIVKLLCDKTTGGIYESLGQKPVLEKKL